MGEGGAVKVLAFPVHTLYNPEPFIIRAERFFGELNMYAVVASGGKQYRVEAGQTLKLETLVAEVGATVNLEKVLMIVDDDKIQVGKPFLSGSKVVASVVGNGRHKKVHIIKFRRRKHHMKQMGHRQNYTEVKISDILVA